MANLNDPSSFRYDTTGKWLKGNTHIHSVASDGGKERMEISEMYSGKGYDFLCAADHWVITDFKNDPAQYPLLWLDGVELNGKDDSGAEYHVVCLGTITGITREMGFKAALQSARDQGAFLILAHPYWMGNSFEEALRWEFDGVEIYNHICHWLNGKSFSGPHWNAMLRHDPNTLGIAADDAHLKDAHPLWDGGWIMVNTSDASRTGIMAAIRGGNYYSTCGPSFDCIKLQGDSVVLETSPVRYIRVVGATLTGQRIMAKGDNLLTGATIHLPDNWEYMYVEIEDDEKRRAWTNTLFAQS